MEVTINLSVTIEADSPKAAYKKLCEALAAIPDSDYETDSYSASNGASGDTSELFPKGRG